MANQLALPKNISVIQTNDATDLATAVALVNEIKAVVNRLIVNQNTLFAEMRKNDMGR